MSRKLKQAKVVTPRDLEIMRLLGTDGVSSFKVIHERFWPGAKERTCRERLTQLEKAGFIESHYVDTRGAKNELVFSLTRKGARDNFSPVERRFMITKLPAYNEIHQQLMAQQARFRLHQQLKKHGLELSGWLNERQLHSQARLKQRPGTRAWGRIGGIADAQAEIMNPATGEIENRNIEVDGAYYGKVLRQKIAGIARAGIYTTWVTTPNRANRIHREISEAGAGSLIEVMVIG